ncbi:MAG: hypothetical protein A2Y10_00560 [Planctomycetes bacterium GWF2_41_51]|nr:MAG: hypothetical protein A2Y10_00560 [Planctomycetes bacterium GWF2_41_51]HBG26893.1 hypothetical protein [Phycisphaerales bacterium]
MMYKKAFLNFIFCSLAITGSVSANLLQNGSFEDPVVPAGSSFIEFPVMPGWIVENSNYYVVFKELGFTPVDGLNELYLFGGTATQNVGTITADTIYNLSFAAGIPDGQTAIYSEVVLLSQYTDGGIVYTDRLAAINLGEVVTTTNQLMYGTLTFDSSIYPWVAGRDMLVQIASGTMLHLDDFVLTAIPEPATLLLIAGGFTLLRRKK